MSVYRTVSVEKRPRSGEYLVSTGADCGYGHKLKTFDDPGDAVRYAESKADEVYVSDTVEQEYGI